MKSQPRSAFGQSRVASLEAFPASSSGGGVEEVSLRKLVRREPLILSPDSTVRNTLFALNQTGAHVAVVAEDDASPLGVVSMRDLITALTLKHADLEDPTFRFMIAAPVVMPVDASVHRARVTMTRRGVDHLVLVEPDGRLFNVLSPSDLPGFREGGAGALVEQIRLADNVDSMARAAKAVRRRAAELFGRRMGVGALCQWISGLNDLIAIRVIGLVADEFDLPPVSWCWVVFGSEGRLEQTFGSDQDNGLIFKPDREEAAAEVRRAMLAFTQSVNRALDICGYRLCPGNVMAGNPAWCLSENEWREKFLGWMREPDPQAVLHAAIFFDFRPLYGQDELCDELRQWLLPQPAAHPRFLRAMAEQALGCTPALGVLGNFTYDGGHRYPHTIDLKMRGSRPFIDAARIWALQHEVWSTNTADRLRAVGPALNQRDADTVASVEAFDIVQRVRTQRQMEGGDTDAINRIDPARLTAPDRMLLKAAFREGKRLQLRLEQTFLN